MLQYLTLIIYVLWVIVIMVLSALTITLMSADIRSEIFCVTQACERLLSMEQNLTEDEHALLEFYIGELSLKFFPLREREGRANGSV